VNKIELNPDQIIEIKAGQIWKHNSMCTYRLILTSPEDEYPYSKCTDDLYGACSYSNNSVIFKTSYVASTLFYYSNLVSDKDEEMMIMLAYFT
jgi:hypothetical protein